MFVGFKSGSILLFYFSQCIFIQKKKKLSVHLAHLLSFLQGVSGVPFILSQILNASKSNTESEVIVRLNMSLAAPKPKI